MEITERKNRTITLISNDGILNLAFHCICLQKLHWQHKHDVCVCITYHYLNIIRYRKPIRKRKRFPKLQCLNDKNARVTRQKKEKRKEKHLAFTLGPQNSFSKLVQLFILLSNSLIHEDRRLPTLLILLQQRFVPLPNHMKISPQQQNKTERKNASILFLTHITNKSLN